MKRNGLSHIRRWLLVYMFLVVMTTLAAFLLVYKEVLDILSSPALTAGLHSSALASGGIKLRVLLLLTGGLLAIAFLSIIWMRIVSHRINRPIRSIQLAVSRLAQGKLNETVTVENAEEFSQIASGINEIAANLQELLLYIWKQTGECMATLEQIELTAELREPRRLTGTMDEQVQKLSSAIESLREMAKSYVFYDVRLDGEQALAINQPGQKESTHSGHSSLQ